MTEAQVQPKGSITYDASNAVAMAVTAKASLTTATELTIDSPLMLEAAGEELQAIKTLQEKVEASRTSITKPMNDALKAVNALFKAPAEFLALAEAKIKSAMLTYREGEERRIADARRKADEEAMKERDRLAEIARGKEREAREAADRSIKLDREALAAEDRGDIDTAIAARDEAELHREDSETAQSAAEDMALQSAIVTVPALQEAPQKVTGISSRKTYSAEVIDLSLLVAAIAGGKAPIEAICADEKFLNQQARAFKKEGALYPGVKAVAIKSIAARR